MLRVADEHAGKPLRCPACNHISTAPSTSPSVAAAPPPTWHMRTPEGQTYGPVPRDELDRWVGQGRIATDCELGPSAAGPWEPATSMFPALVRLAPKPADPPPAFTPPSPFGASSYAYSSAAATSQYVQPHRGGLILVLGLVGIVMGCPIFSLMAWVMGSGDLREMRSGRMDRNGEGLTQAGMILGMIPSILFIVGAALAMLFIIVVAVAGR